MIPFYGVYVVLFADSGLSTAEISSLLIIWSATSFVLEIPSGAWADLVSRRMLLAGSAILLAGGFAAWSLWQTYEGFAVGFVLWGTAGALQSGTFEALIYDELIRLARTSDYTRINGYLTGARELGALIGILSGAPLYAIGGYELIGVVSVVAAAGHGFIALTLPEPPPTQHATDEDEPQVSVRAYLNTLRVGLAEVVHSRTVRGGVLLSSLLFGYTAFDEYFGLLAREVGIPTGQIPLLVGLSVVGTLAASALAGRFASVTTRGLQIGLVAAAIVFAVAPYIAGPGWQSIVAFALIAAAYGQIYFGSIVASARLQHTIVGTARATTTSVSGFLAEVISVVIFGAVALASGWLSMASAVALMAIPVLATALWVRRWLPPVGR